MLMMLLPMRVIAAQVDGSIELTMMYRGNPIPGGTVTVYDVTDQDEFTDPEKMLRYAQKQKLPHDTVTVSAEGKAQFSGLESGYYLIAQETPADGYLPMKPFLVGIPMQIGGETVYRIRATPKLSPEPETVLPQTGQNHWPVWILGGLGLVLFCTGWIIGKQK